MRVFLAALAACLLVGCAASPTPLTPLRSDAPCHRCTGFLLPGSILPNPDAAYRVDSDLPEIFLSPGVLYATTPVLPPMRTKQGGEIPEAMRTQRNRGFTSIDDSFEVFLYHMSNPTPAGIAGGTGQEERSRRVVVYARNLGGSEAVVTPRQIIEAHGKMAAADGPESRLALRVMNEDWERPLASVRIPAGEGRAIGWTPRLSVPAGGQEPDSTPSDFVTGVLRAEASPGSQLEIHVVGVESSVPIDGLSAACERLKGQGAWSGEGAMNLTIPPPACHVRRVVGVSRNFVWRGEGLVLDAATLGAPVDFLMGAPAMQTVGCEAARQTQDLLLSPPYVHPETIGNYMQEYVVPITLVNRSKEARRVDLRFGKDDADIGLAWQIARGRWSREDLAKIPARVGWAGGWRKDDLPDNTRSFFAEGEAPVVRPGEAVRVSLRFMIVGTSSLPFHIRVVGLGEPVKK